MPWRLGWIWTAVALFAAGVAITATANPALGVIVMATAVLTAVFTL